MSVNTPIKREFSTIANLMKPSAIRLLLKVANQPDIISFGGGLPNPESFPIEDIRKIFDEQLARNGKKMLQYGATEGLDSLNVALSKMLREKEGIRSEPTDFIQTTGSQEALYMIGKIFANPGEYVITEAPTYVGTISAFRGSGVKMVGVEMDHYGMKMDSLRDTLRKYPNPKFIYVIPSFQNPTGITMSIERRKELLEIANERGITIVEDNPYGSLRFAGSHIPTLRSMDSNVVYLGTFSKVLSPGMRLGYVISPADVREKINIAKQALDLASSTLSEYIAEAYVSGGYMERQVPKIIELYKQKRDLMIESFENYFPKDVEFTRPNGGMFLWVTRKGANTDRMFEEAVKQKVLYVVGSAFYPDEDNHESMRLNFTYSSNENIVEGVKRLGKLFEATK
ncbi:MAG: PLP-dependent aminotransferase family protein [Thermoplasmatales archaeon]|nr:PLP-dependent aminotransferase family protein [Candidatus Thermoplasmatota archaeon]MDA8055994.1 PLP-dependent aminotransferase family protein [Thermoplasmatales archaeon]